MPLEIHDRDSLNADQLSLFYQTVVLLSMIIWGIMLHRQHGLILQFIYKYTLISENQKEKQSGQVFLAGEKDSKALQKNLSQYS
jgi:hypothetical protein